MRLFVALEIPKVAVTYISNLQAELKQAIQADRWQPMHNLHLTLHFLGDLKEELVPELCHDMDMVSAIVKPFSLTLGRFGAFPHRDKPRVLWLGLSGEHQILEQLHLLLGKRFDLHPGVEFDKRAYRPHITLARGPKAPEGGLPLHEWNERYLSENPPHWEVSGVHLYHSELKPQGAVHTIIHTTRLGSEVLHTVGQV